MNDAKEHAVERYYAAWREWRTLAHGLAAEYKRLQDAENKDVEPLQTDAVCVIDTGGG